MYISFFRHLLFLPLFIAHATCLHSFSMSLAEGDKWFDAGLFPEAIKIYQSEIDHKDPNENLFPSSEKELLKLRLAHSHFALKQYEACIKVLQEVEKSEDKHYWLGVCYTRLNDRIKAIEMLSHYLKSCSSDKRYIDEARFELAKILSLEGKLEQSAIQFQQLTTSPNADIQFLSKLYLGKIDIASGRYKKAKAFLSSIVDSAEDNALNHKHLLHELLFLQGVASFKLQNYPESYKLFEKALPDLLNTKDWQNVALNYLGWCCVYLGQKNPQDKDLCNKAITIFTQLLKNRNEEGDVLNLAIAYLAFAKYGEGDDYYAKARSLLSQTDSLHSDDAKANALILQAEAFPTHEERLQQFDKLIQKTNQDDPSLAFFWYSLGKNHYMHANNVAQELDQKKQWMQRSVNALKKADGLSHPPTANIIKLLTLAISAPNTLSSYKEAYDYLSAKLNLRKEVDLHYMQGYLASRMVVLGDSQYFQMAKEQLEKVANDEDNPSSQEALENLAAMYYACGKYGDAETLYLKFASLYPDIPSAGDAWFFAACAADQLNLDRAVGKERRRKAFECYPAASKAKEACFSYYTFAEYLQGDRDAIKHLQLFLKLYPNAPQSLEAHYLIGLDFKRDRKTPEGKWIRKKSLTEAIDAFHLVASKFDEMAKQNLFENGDLNYYVALGYQAHLERAQTTLAIADESQGAKRQIYLEYAEDVFKELIDPKNPYLAKLLTAESNQDFPFPSLYAESLFGLAKTHLKRQNEAAAVAVFTKMLQRYKDAKFVDGYYLCKVWSELGKIALKKGDFSVALQHFMEAKQTGKEMSLLSTDERLQLLIDESLCHRGLKAYDLATLILSQVINDPAISSLRIQAMYLRAENYEEQGRYDLARKQLESIIKKGGHWSKKAQEKLEILVKHDL